MAQATIALVVFRRLPLIAAVLGVGLALSACQTRVDCGQAPPLGVGLDGAPLPPDMIAYHTCQAGKNNDMRSQVLLGRVYDEGKMGPPADVAQAIKWYEMAAHDRPGGPTGVYVPGVGGGAGYWMPLNSAPGQPGHFHAQYRLGVFYRDGTGYPRDAKKARRLFEKSAAQGYTPAMRALEQMPE
jgi:TPR repeat protein